MAAERNDQHVPLAERSHGFPLIPATAVTGTTLIGASAGSLGGGFSALIFAMVGLVWGLLAVRVATRLNRSWRRATFANASVYAAAFAAALLTGVGLESTSIMDASVDRVPQFFADLVRPPIGDAEAVPFYVLNTSLEWLLIPAVVLLNAWIPKRQKLILSAAVIFFALRVWSYLYFIPEILHWNQGTTGQPLTPGQLEQASLWVDLSWVRLAMDAAIALLLLGAAFVPPRFRASNETEPQSVTVS
jgi:hypothetical protein